LEWLSFFQPLGFFMKDKVYQEKKRIYCAIYTRKSTSESLDQDFTSLDAQREAAENYIASQRNEGWLVLPERYDDGGYTGANLERPALQRLLSDIRDGRVDCVVVYKVDRLSRSLLDFAQLLEFFDKHKVTFVSVTQNFNTNTSMGRLTLNILLSFAQFEREIISERTRDKMAAGRRKGKWLGGRPVLGYDLDRENHRLVVNEKEAEIVREIFYLYIKEGSLRTVAAIMNDKGFETKKFVTRSGKVLGGKRFKIAYIQHIIKNVLYIGKVKYMGQIYPGLHEPIIEEDIFEKAQEILVHNRVKRQRRKNNKNLGLLSHLLRCKACNSPMFHTYSVKGDYNYRYYVCLDAQKGGYRRCPTRAVNAQAIEEAVINILRKIYEEGKAQEERTKPIGETKKEIKDLQEIQYGWSKMREDGENLGSNRDSHNPSIIELKNLQGKILSDGELMEVRDEEEILTGEQFREALSLVSSLWDTLFPEEKRRILKLLLREVDFDGRDGTIGLTLKGSRIELFDSKINLLSEVPLNTLGDPKSNLRFEFKVALKRPRQGRSLGKIFIEKEPLLRQNLVLAYQIQELLERKKVKNLNQVAQWLHKTRARVSQIMHLLFLAPDIQEEILFLKKEAISHLTEHMIREIIKEIDWIKQRKMWNEIWKIKQAQE